MQRTIVVSSYYIRMSVGLFVAEIYAIGFGRKNWRGGFNSCSQQDGLVINNYLLKILYIADKS
jgi:hypothetical protein